MNTPRSPNQSDQELPEPANANDQKLIDYAERYLRSIKITAGCRFEASRRLSAKDAASTATVAMLSLYVVAAAIMNYVPEASAIIQLGPLLPLVTVSTSVFILVLSLLDHAQRYGVRADQMLRCGQELNELLYELELSLASENLDLATLKEVKKRYDHVINKYPENHTQADFHYFRTRRPHRLNHNWLMKRWLVIWHTTIHYLERWGFHGALLLTPPILAYSIATLS